MTNPALEIIFPQRCAGCGDGAWPFCDGCRATLTPLTPPWCERCGRPWIEPIDRCRDCPPGEVESARAPFRFEGPARRAIHRLKFSGWRGVGLALASAMAAVDDRPASDVVTWVPLARRRLAERGFDQAKVLAFGVARTTGVPARPLLRRAVATGPQARRGAAERRRAMVGAFGAHRRSGQPVGRVLLVDDVLTTGATASAAAAALREQGATAVHLLVAARAFPGPVRGAYTRAGPRPGLWLPGDIPR